MTKDIVDRLTAWVDCESREPDPVRAVLDARDAIVQARKQLLELSAAVIGSTSLREARGHAMQMAPLKFQSVLMQGFHEVECRWRTMRETASDGRDST